MQSEVRVANVSLQSLESAIAETVRSGANSEEIRRVVEAATLRFHDNHKKTRTFHSASRYLFNRVHLFGLLCCALVVFLIAFTVSFRAQQISQRNQVELKDVWENINVLMGITTDDGVGDGDGEKDNHAAEPAVSQYASAANYLARFLANDVPATRSKPTICPLDAFFSRRVPRARRRDGLYLSRCDTETDRCRELGKRNKWLQGAERYEVLSGIVLRRFQLPNRPRRECKPSRIRGGPESVVCKLHVLRRILQIRL
uniref:Uncharacterized protein n=1 Tax=Ditylum brightwellii TaxID=49249 RepID=A0A7S4QJJ6_9STRA